MFADRARGGAGLAFAFLGLLLLRGGPGLSETVAAAGCKDDSSCYMETREEGVVGGDRIIVTSHTATCKGDCSPGLSCEPLATQNSDGSTTFQCSCSTQDAPSSCSGIATVDASGQVQSFSCQGDCVATTCRKQTYNVQIDRNCPTGTSRNRKCICE